MKRKIILVVFLVIGFAQFGCAWRTVKGTPIKEANILKVEAGKTTRTQIFELFGTPFKTDYKAGKEILTYLYVTNFFATGGIYTETREKADILVFHIEENGVVSNYSFSKGAPLSQELRDTLFLPQPKL